MIDASLEQFSCVVEDCVAAAELREQWRLLRPLCRSSLLNVAQYHQYSHFFQPAKPPAAQADALEESQAMLRNMSTVFDKVCTCPVSPRK